MKNLVSFLSLVSLFFSCSELKQPAQTDDNAWLMGKTFASSLQNNMPEGGGSDFVTFDDTKSGVLKTGDIAQLMTYTIANDVITITGSQFNHTVILTIKNHAYLLDTYGNKWKTKQ